MRFRSARSGSRRRSGLFMSKISSSLFCIDLDPAPVRAGVGQGARPRHSDVTGPPGGIEPAHDTYGAGIVSGPAQTGGHKNFYPPTPFEYAGPAQTGGHKNFYPPTPFEYTHPPRSNTRKNPPTPFEYTPVRIRVKICAREIADHLAIDPEQLSGRGDHTGDDQGGHLGQTGAGLEHDEIRRRFEVGTASRMGAENSSRRRNDTIRRT